MGTYLLGGAGMEFQDGVVRGSFENYFSAFLRQIIEIVLLLFQVLHVPSELILSGLN
jgi:hypothetical protein